MGSTTISSPPPLAWGVAARTLPGQPVCGDLHLVKPLNHGVQLAVVDGLGHGETATAAAVTCLAVLERFAEEPLASLTRRCHLALTKTRGVVMTLGYLDRPARTLTWLGVGNVEGLLLRADIKARPRSERVMLHAGVVGYILPDLRAGVVPLAPGDLLVFVTDGIHPGFEAGWLSSDPPQQIADHIIERYARPTDDALALVVRYPGEGYA